MLANDDLHLGKMREISHSEQTSSMRLMISGAALLFSFCLYYIIYYSLEIAEISTHPIGIFYLVDNVKILFKYSFIVAAVLLLVGFWKRSQDLSLERQKNFHKIAVAVLLGFLIFFSVMFIFIYVQPTSFYYIKINNFLLVANQLVQIMVDMILIILIVEIAKIKRNEKRINRIMYTSYFLLYNLAVDILLFVVLARSPVLSDQFNAMNLTKFVVASIIIIEFIVQMGIQKKQWQKKIKKDYDFEVEDPAKETIEAKRVIRESKKTISLGFLFYLFCLLPLLISKIVLFYNEEISLQVKLNDFLKYAIPEYTSILNWVMLILVVIGLNILEKTMNGKKKKIFFIGKILLITYICFRLLSTIIQELINAIIFSGSITDLELEIYYSVELVFLILNMLLLISSLIIIEIGLLELNRNKVTKTIPIFSPILLVGSLIANLFVYRNIFLNIESSSMATVLALNRFMAIVSIVNITVMIVVMVELAIHFMMLDVNEIMQRMEKELSILPEG